MRLKSWGSKAAIVGSFLLGLWLMGSVRVRTQAPFLVFGSSSGSSQVVQSTANALWVSLQGGVATLTSISLGGANPASTGAIRLANNAPIVSRNVGNTADIFMTWVDGSNNLVLGGGPSNSQTASWYITAGAGNLFDNGTHVLQVGGQINLGATLAISAIAPTITSGFGSGTAGTLVTGSTAFNFRITVGTNAGGTTGVIGLPAATNFWNCKLADQNTPLDVTNQTGSTLSSATFTSTVAWTTGDILIGGCTAS